MQDNIEELVRLRLRLVQICELHVESIARFLRDPSFGQRAHSSKVDGAFETVLSFPGMLEFEDSDASSAPMLQLATAVRCVASLLSCPIELRPKNVLAPELMLPTFTTWSTGYLSKCPTPDLFTADTLTRTICLLIKTSSLWSSKLPPRVGRLTQSILSEALRQRSDASHCTYQLYWRLKLLDLAEDSPAQRRDTDYGVLRDVTKSRVLSALTLQIALHTQSSSAGDTDQLAWALVAHARLARRATPTLVDREITRAGLQCLFASPSSDGIWPSQRPLHSDPDHEPVFSDPYECLAMLLRESLVPRSGDLRRALRSFQNELNRTVEYTLATQVRLRDRAREVGWRWQRHSQRQAASAWATANTFAFLQAFRRLNSEWTAAAALDCQPRFLPGLATRPADVESEFATYGAGWNAPGTPSVADHLLSLFIYPQLLAARRRENMGVDADRPSLRGSHARSAILFGPPGTGKTTLARLVADSLGWAFVEIRASDFVADGFMNIHRTADRLFRNVMQLSSCVVLFDEIDELVRSRGTDSEVFGRFLTTGMLPKIAELWSQGRLIYFVATNHLEYFDDAITRSHRFDAAIHVAPPSFVARQKALLAQLNSLDARPSVLHSRQSTKPQSPIRFEWDAALRVDQFEDALLEAAKAFERKPAPHWPDGVALEQPWAELAKFVALRWDQLPELASQLRLRLFHSGEVGEIAVISRAVLAEALAAIQDESLRNPRVYSELLAARRREKFDYGRLRAWEVASGSVPPEFLLQKFPNAFTALDTRVFFVTNHRFDVPLRLSPALWLARADESPGMIRASDAHNAGGEL